MNKKYTRLDVRARRSWFLFLALALLTANLHAQEEIPLQVLTPEQNRTAMDIRTSTLSELAAWCRSLGLPEAGTSADLARRLREYYHLTEQALQGSANAGSSAGANADEKRKVITIESARSSEYFTIETVNEDYARLSGEVRISLKDGEATHNIQAWNILFNRTRNILTASGGVVYEKKDGDQVETFRGETITVDLDNWSSIFLGGVSERSMGGGTTQRTQTSNANNTDNTTYKFAGTVISRDEEEVIVLSHAAIGTANNPESLWSLNASRVWLLPGSDFAILNAVLKVGEIPVLYIPFFYFPADEVIFHPVIGNRQREGNFVQTTTYILGRPKADAGAASQSSLTRILGNSSDMEKRREGLFLRSTGKKSSDPNKVSLRAIVDHYANLGTYLGTDLELPAKGIMNALNMSLGIGITRSIDLNNNPFYDDGGTTASDWNKSNLFSMEVPFRYRLKTNSGIGGKYGSFTWDFPYYSDPFVDSDFVANRAESMDWVNMIQKGAAQDTTATTQNQQGNYTWNFTGQVNPKFPSMTPYINNISINSIFSNVSFKTVSTPTTGHPVKDQSPSRLFYAPDQATLFSLGGTITGTPLSFGQTATASRSTATTTTTTAASTANKAAEPADPLFNIGVPRSPFEDREAKDEDQKDQADLLVPPELTQRFDLPKIGNNRLSLTYSISPSGSSTLKFDSNKWKEFSDVDWGDITSVLSNFQGTANTTLNFSHSENFYSSVFTYSGVWTWREFWYLNEEADEFMTAGATDPQKIENEKLRELKASNFSTSYSLVSSLRPLFRNATFGNSSLQHTMRGLAIKSDLVENATVDNPEWELIKGEWKPEKITEHSINSTLSARIMDKNQTFSVIADLPPRDAAFTFRTGLSIWITQTDANMKMRKPSEKELNDGEKDEWRREPFTLTERINFGTFGSLSQSLILDTKEVELSSLTTSLNLSKWGITSQFAMTRQLGYEWIIKGSDATNPSFEGWRTRAGKAEAGDPNFTLRPRDFTLNYNKNFNMKELFGNRIQFSASIRSNLFIDLQRYTSSWFSFAPGFTFKINNFLDLTLSSSSRNNNIYRYFKDWDIFKIDGLDIQDVNGSTNLFRDLLNSFAFGNEDLRKLSGFKIENFNIKATHHLGDWDLIFNWTMKPYTISGKPTVMNNEVAFLLQWTPISEIKTDVTFNKQNDPMWFVQQ